MPYSRVPEIPGISGNEKTPLGMNSLVKHSFMRNLVAAYVRRFVPISYLFSLNAHIHEKCTPMFTV